MRPLEPVMMTLVIILTPRRKAARRKENSFAKSSVFAPLRLCVECFHSNTPQRFSVVRSASQFFGFIGTSGRRYSSSMTFIIASAAFTGVGFVSMNKSLNSG